MSEIAVVSGAIANKYLSGGEAWVRLSWVLGLRRLGWDVFFVEEIDPATCVDAHEHPAPFESSANVAYFKQVMDRFELGSRAALVCDERAEGLSLDRLEDIAREADVLINISGHLRRADLLPLFRRKVYVDLDPGFTQFWHAAGSDIGLRDHDAYFTVGENIGTPASPIPTDGIPWRAVRPPVVLEDWPRRPGGDATRFTTVGAWRGGYGPVEHEGRRYGLKVHEFRKVIELPRQVPMTFELALDIHPADAADREALESHGWRLVDPAQVAAGPGRFREYVQGSGAEFSVAQGIYVETQSGWFSDRTVRYLASGKPALVQDTGFSENYPVGEGLVPFTTLDEAAAGAARIAANYDLHCAAARRLAETCFDSDVVLPRFLTEAGVGT